MNIKRRNKVKMCGRIARRRINEVLFDAFYEQFWRGFLERDEFDFLIGRTP
jgi:hypothetical protein